MTQAELAGRLEYRSASAIGMWETGERKPPSPILPRLARELGCGIEELYSEPLPIKTIETFNKRGEVK